MGTDEDGMRAQNRSDPVKPVDLENPYPSPIVVRTGKGSYLRLPTPGTVVERLGGRSQLNERLQAILASHLSGDVVEHDAEALTPHYDEFLQRLEVISYPTPIHIDPNGGWSVTIPIPATVVEELGGSSRLNERLASIYVSTSRPAGVDPATAVKLTADYDRLLGQIETVINRPEH